MQGSDSKILACELRIKQFSSCKLPAEQFVSQFVCEFWVISVCTLFQFQKCERPNLFWKCCSLLDKKCSYNLTNITNIPDIFNPKKAKNLKEGSLYLNKLPLQLPKNPVVRLMWKIVSNKKQICVCSIYLSLSGSVRSSLHRCYVEGYS